MPPPPPPPPPPPFLEGNSGRGFTYERGVIRDLQAYVADVANRARGGRGDGTQRDRVSLRSTIRAMINDITGRNFEVVVPGTHPPAPTHGQRRESHARDTARFRRHLSRTGRHLKGTHTISNQALFEILAAKGKDFLRISPSMIRRARTDLTIEFENATEIPLLLDLEIAMRDSVLSTVTARLENRLRDVRIKANSSKWTRYKLDHGYDSRVGVMSGNLLGSVARLRLRFMRGRR